MFDPFQLEGNDAPDCPEPETEAFFFEEAEEDDAFMLEDTAY